MQTYEVSSEDSMTSETAAWTTNPRKKIRTQPLDGSIKKQMAKLKLEYDNECGRPKSLPYNRNMVRQFVQTEPETSEERKRKNEMAELSRLSRNRSKYFHMRLAEDIPQLQAILNQQIERLVQLEEFTNSFLQRDGFDAVDFSDVWEDK